MEEIDGLRPAGLGLMGMKIRLPGLLRKVCAILLLTGGALWLSGSPAFAGTAILRDAEIEGVLAGFARPVMQAAGIPERDVRMHIVDDVGVNAFVAGGMNIFINTGLILETRAPLEMMGVIAHETGHIAGAHLIGQREAISNASAQALLAMVLGTTAAVVSGNSDAGGAIILGGQEMARRGFLSFSRSQESSADQAAIAYLHRAGFSVSGLETFLARLLHNEGGLAGVEQDYLSTHPLTDDRLSAVTSAVKSEEGLQALPDVYGDMFDRMKAKTMAYVYPESALRLYEGKDSVSALYGRAVALWRRKKIPDALAICDSLMAREAWNPFFVELKAQILMEDGKVAKAIPLYRQAYEKAGGIPLIGVSLAHALIESGQPDVLDEAIVLLERASSREGRMPELHRLLAVAYGQKGEEGLAVLHAAGGAALSGDMALAISQAQRASDLLPTGSPGWLRAQDLLLSLKKQ